jgi:hypothetical protein
MVVATNPVAAAPSHPVVPMGSSDKVIKALAARAHTHIRNKVIVCPNKDKPGIKEAANANYKEWLECHKKLNNKHKEQSISYKKLSKKDKAQMCKSVPASLCISNATSKASTITTDSSTQSPPAKKSKHDEPGHQHFGLLSASPLKNILPAPIVKNFPHIHIQLGSELDDPSCPVLRCIINMANALTTGNFHFVVAIAKQYPHCVAKIFVPEDYNPIKLSRIVQRGSKSITTELMVGF